MVSTESHSYTPLRSQTTSPRQNIVGTANDDQGSGYIPLDLERVNLQMLSRGVVETNEPGVHYVISPNKDL